MPRPAFAPLLSNVRRIVPALACVLLLPGCALLNGNTKPSDTATPQSTAGGGAAGHEAAPAFDIAVESPDSDIRALVEKYNDLRRYRRVPDLEPAELQRLVALEDADVRKLVATEGYFSPTVHVELKSGDKPPQVEITVDPGEATRVKQVDIRFEGDIATSTDPGAIAQRNAIRADWSLKDGRRFTEDRWSGAKNDALRRLVEKRYPRGKIVASRAHISPENAAAALEITLDSGPAFYLGKPVVLRAQRYPADLAPRLSWLKPGEVYEQKKLVDAQQRLATTGYYRSAFISIDPEGNPDAVPVRYLLTEDKIKKVQFGLGYSTDSGPRLSIEHHNNKLFGSDWRSDSKLDINAKTPVVQFGLTGLPDAAGWRRGASIGAMRQDDGTLTTLSETARVGITKTAERYDRSLYLQFDHANVTGSGGQAVPAALLGDGAAISANYNWTARYFDNMFSPTRGYGLGLDAAAGVTTIGPKLPFTRLDARWLGLVPVSKRAGFFSLRSEAAAVIASNQARIPATYLFRTGGDTTVRGYGYRAIGIPVGQDLVAPGRYMVVASAEFVHPILQTKMPGLLDQVFFVDYGSVARRASELHPHWGLGSGVRANTPVGPMEIDLAYGLQSKTWHIHMNVGFTF